MNDNELADRLRQRRGTHRSMQDKIDQIAAADRVEALSAEVQEVSMQAISDIATIEELTAEVERLRAAGNELADWYKDYDRLWDNESLQAVLDKWRAALREES